eukprot:7785-Heterococcus_DN1.PRE.6
MKKGELLLMDEQHTAAQELYRGLIERGTDNYIFHRGLQCAVLAKPWAETAPLFALKACALPSSALQLTDADRALLVELYTELQQKYPHSAAAKRIPLAFLQGDAFHTALDAYLKRMWRPFEIRKGAVYKFVTIAVNALPLRHTTIV